MSANTPVRGAAIVMPAGCLASRATRFWYVALFSLSSPALLACEAPEGRFCVDFFAGHTLEGKPAASARAPYIKYNWGNHSPGKQVPHDNFSARWRGRFDFAEGAYRFRSLADENVRILIDGLPILEDAPVGTEKRVEFTPGPGQHLVEVEYHESHGTALLEVDWKPVADQKSVSESSPGRSPDTRSGASGKLPVTNQARRQLDRPATSMARDNIRRDNQAPLGINLSSFNYWSPAVPFKDLLLQTGGIGVYQQGSKEVCKQSVSFDAQGYPDSVPHGCVFRIWSVFHIPDDELGPTDVYPYQPGRYVLSYQGNGKIQLGWDAKNTVKKAEGRIEFDVVQPRSGIQIEVSDSDPNHPVRDMHLVHISDEASFKQQPFNEKWLDLLKPFSVIRFKDWERMDESLEIYHAQAVLEAADTLRLPDSASSDDSAFSYPMVAKVNIGGKISRVFIEHYDGASRTLHLQTPIDQPRAGAQVDVNMYTFVNRNWSQRAKPDTLTQASSAGVAFETMIQLANTLDAAPWISIPTAADDDFVRNLAMLIKQQLKPGLKCYVEYSNETWNFIYPGYAYSEAKTREKALNGTLIPSDAWHAYRAVEIFKIFNRVFGEADLRHGRHHSRLVRVLTSQTAYFNRAKSVMDWKMPGDAYPTGGLPAYQYADAWASTAYFGFKDSKAGEVLEQSSFADLTKLQLEDIETMFGSKAEPGILRQLFTEAHARGMQFVTYEAGAGMLAPGNRKDLVVKAGRLNQSPGMRSAYQAMLQHWAALYREYGADAIGVWTQYYDVGRYSKSGYWGLLQSTYQEPTEVPKYQAILDYMSGRNQ